MKSLIKKILPSAWVALVANAINKVNRLIIAPVFFKEFPPEKIHHIRNLCKRPVELIFKNPTGNYKNLPPVIADSFIDFNSVEQKEFVSSVDQCLIEPKYGWPMTKSRELIYDCFPYSRQNIIPLPSISSLRGTSKRFKKIISFREIFEFGYWHFHTDIVHKNYLLEQIADIDQHTPILISEALSRKSYFKFFSEKTDVFHGREIIVQSDFVVHADTAYFIKPLPHRPEYYKRTSEKLTHWKGDFRLNRRVFLTRAKSRGRTIFNIEELNEVLIKYGFEFFDADALSIEEQIKLFSETAWLVGIHGAGLTNMMFRFPNTMKVLEIFPFASGRYEIPPHYFLLSGIFGFSYDALLGGEYNNKIAKNFHVDPRTLDNALKRLVAS